MARSLEDFSLADNSRKNVTATILLILRNLRGDGGPSLSDPRNFVFLAFFIFVFSFISVQNIQIASQFDSGLEMVYSIFAYSMDDFGNFGYS